MSFVVGGGFAARSSVIVEERCNLVCKKYSEMFEFFNTVITCSSRSILLELFCDTWYVVQFVYSH